MLREVLENIEKRSRFVLTSHARPDGDAIGSALACGQILRAMGKEAEVVMHDPVPRIGKGCCSSHLPIRWRMSIDYHFLFLVPFSTSARNFCGE